MDAWGQRWFIAAAWAAVPLVFLTARAVWFAQREVLVTPAGIVVYGIGEKTFAWKNIEGIAVEDNRYHLLGITLRTRNRVRLYPTTGTPIRFDDRYKDLPGLTETIKRNLCPVILPTYRALLHEGQWIYFGLLRFNPTTLDTGKRTIPWEEIESLRVHNGVLNIAQRDGRAVKIPTAKIPNVELLLQLVEELYTEQ
jgi:hypothetical protein